MVCVGFFGRLFGHKYKPRHSIGEFPNTVSEEQLYNHIIIEGGNPEDFCSKTYEADVCVRCGNKLENNNEL